MIEKYNRTKCKKTAEEIGILIKGLSLLQDVATVDGFIARGVADDGVGHYPMSAECQIFPWILAMNAYYRSELCADRDEIKNRLLRVLLALRENDFKIPHDKKGAFYPGGWLNGNAWRPVTMLVYSARLIYELTKDENDLLRFRTLMSAVPQNSVFSREEILSQGSCHEMLTSFGNQTWICLYAHLAIRELLWLDPDRSEIYQRGLYMNGVTALKNLPSIKKYDNVRGGFGIDWRPLCALWEDSGPNFERGTEIAQRQFAYWHEHIVPHRNMEHSVLGNALFAMWTAVTCEDERIVKQAVKEMEERIPLVDWAGLRISYAFVAESALIFAP